MVRNLPLVIIVVTVLVAWHYRRESESSAPVAVSPKPAATATASIASQVYSCDGRTTCSQMTSCEEATFFLKNCPNTMMDGDHDGIPCEQQWCHN
jgi:hypothetical protein